MRSLISRTTKLADEGDLGSTATIERVLKMPRGSLKTSGAVTWAQGIDLGSAIFDVVLDTGKPATKRRPAQPAVLHLFPCDKSTPAGPVLALLNKAFGATEFNLSAKGRGGWVSYKRPRAELVFTFDCAKGTSIPAIFNAIMLFETPAT